MRRMEHTWHCVPVRAWQGGGFRRRSGQGTHRQEEAMRQRVHGCDVRWQRDCLHSALQAVGCEGGLLQHAEDAVSLHPREGRPCYLRMARAPLCAE